MRPGIEQRRDLAFAACNESAVFSPLLWSLEAELAPTDAQKLIKSRTVFAA
jgi:hypothetical protein